MKPAALRRELAELRRTVQDEVALLPGPPAGDEGVPLAGELARRELSPADFTVIRPTLEDAVVSLLNGGLR